MANADTMRANLLRRGNDVVAEATRLMVDELRLAAPLGETGDTRRGIESVPGGSEVRPAATIRSTGKGGDFVEAGTRPHVIVPRSGSALRFVGSGGRISQPAPNSRIATRAGGVVFVKRVNHPGTPPRPWFRPVVDRWGEFVARAASRL